MVLVGQDRFSRVQHAAKTASGKCPMPSTIASDHLLNEGKLLHHSDQPRQLDTLTHRIRGK